MRRASRPAVALLEALGAVGAKRGDELAGEPLGRRVVDGQLGVVPAHVAGDRAHQVRLAEARAGREGRAGCRPRPGASATASAAAWAKRLPGPITNRSNSWRGVDRHRLGDAGGAGAGTHASRRIDQLRSARSPCRGAGAPPRANRDSGARPRSARVPGPSDKGSRPGRRRPGAARSRGRRWPREASARAPSERPPRSLRGVVSFPFSSGTRLDYNGASTGPFGRHPANRGEKTERQRTLHGRSRRGLRSLYWPSPARAPWLRPRWAPLTYEAHLAAKEAQASEDPRFSQSYAHALRPRRAPAPAGKGPQAPYPLMPAGGPEAWPPLAERRLRPRLSRGPLALESLLRALRLPARRRRRRARGRRRRGRASPGPVGQPQGRRRGRAKRGQARDPRGFLGAFRRACRSSSTS